MVTIITNITKHVTAIATTCNEKQGVVSAIALNDAQKYMKGLYFSDYIFNN